MAGDQVNVLGRIAVKGQATCLYGAPNTGKTLFTLYMMMKSAEQGVIEPAKVFYINMDDHLGGLADKTQLAEEFGFEILAGGQRNFDLGPFKKHLTEMVESDTVNGEILVLDTLKKFVDTMDKAKVRDFTSLIRKFVLQGGTVIALAHTNKKPDSNGRSIYSGTTDIRDDFDCVYVLDKVASENDKHVVVFQNIKSRGGVAEMAAYAYERREGASYSEIIASVEEVDPKEWTPFCRMPEQLLESALIDGVQNMIAAGFTAKMELARAVAKTTDCSRQAAVRLIEQYTGQLWDFTRGERGVHKYVLLNQPTG